MNINFSEMVDFDIPRNENATIKVIGVGGGGSNAVNYMFSQGIKDVAFVVCNTDIQALKASPVPIKVQMGDKLTEGRGAGNMPEVGENSAIENTEDIKRVLSGNTKMVFITAGMGGGTGTGAAPVIAELARSLGILTIGIVTMPFRFEGSIRCNQAVRGLQKLKNSVDSLLIIDNEKIREIYGNLKISEAFSKADDVLTTAAKGIADIINIPGYVQVDLSDVEAVVKDSGLAILGAGRGNGEKRALDAVRNALTSPLLNNNDIRGAKNVLLNISSGFKEVTMDEVSFIIHFVQRQIGKGANIVWGNVNDKTLVDDIIVTLVATGFESETMLEIHENQFVPNSVVEFEIEDRRNIEEIAEVYIKKEVTNKIDLDNPLILETIIERSQKVAQKFDNKPKVEKTQNKVFQGILKGFLE